MGGCDRQGVRPSFHYVFAEQDGAITGVLPLVHLRTRLFGNTLVSTPFCVYGGPLAADRETASALGSTRGPCGDSLAHPLSNFVTGLQSRAIGCPGPTCTSRFASRSPPIMSENMKAIPRKQRAMVRKGIQNGLRSVIDADVDVLTASTPRACATSARRCSRRRYFRYPGAAFGETASVTVMDRGAPIARC